MRLFHTPRVCLDVAVDHAGWEEFHPELRGALLGQLDDSATLEDVFGSLLVQNFAVTDILEILRWLDGIGAVEEAPGSPVAGVSLAQREQFAEQIRLLDEWDSPAGGRALFPTRGLVAQGRLARTELAIVGDGSAARRLAELLATLGMTTVELVGGDASARTDRVQDDELPTDGMFVYCPDTPDLAECLRLNDLALSLGIPLAVYWPTGGTVEIGPIVEPRQTACFQCYRQRMRGAGVDDLDRTPGAARLAAPIGLDLLALDIVKFVAGVTQPLTRGAVLRLDLLSGRSELHHVLKLPRCPACGLAPDAAPPRRLWTS